MVLWWYVLGTANSESKLSCMHRKKKTPRLFLSPRWPSLVYISLGTQECQKWTQTVVWKSQRISVDRSGAIVLNISLSRNSISRCGVGVGWTQLEDYLLWAENSSQSKSLLLGLVLNQIWETEVFFNVNNWTKLQQHLDTKHGQHMFIWNTDFCMNSVNSNSDRLTQSYIQYILFLSQTYAI